MRSPTKSCYPCRLPNELLFGFCISGPRQAVGLNFKRVGPALTSVNPSSHISIKDRNHLSVNFRILDGMQERILYFGMKG